MKELKFADKIKKEMENPSYNQLNLSSNPFLPYIPLEISKMFVDRIEEQNILVRYVSSLINDEINGIMILGSKGIGKTHFVKYIQQGMKPLAKQFGLKFFFIDDNDSFEDYLLEYATPHSETHIIFLDNFEEVFPKNKATIFNLLAGVERVKVIISCNQRAWQTIKRDVFSREIKITSLFLSELSDGHLVDIVEKRIKEKLIGESPFNKAALERIAHYSDGVPYTMVYYTEKVLHYCLDKKCKKINPEVIDNFINSLNIKKIDLIILTEMQREVLKKLLDITSSYKRGVSTNELAEQMGKNRATIFEHLKILKEKNIVESYNNPKDKKTILNKINPSLMREIEKFFTMFEGIKISFKDNTKIKNDKKEGEDEA